MEVKIILFSIIVGFLNQNFFQATMIAYEGFDYPTRSSLNGLNGGTGWKGAWFGGKANAGSLIVDPNMTFTGLTTSGKKSQQKGDDVRIFRYMDMERSELASLVADGTHGKALGKPGTTVWVSFLIACTSYPKLAHGGIHFMDGVELGENYKKTQRLQLGRQNMGTHWLLVRVDQGGPAAGKWDGTVTSDATVRLLVYRFDFKDTSAEGWMWVDPIPGQAPNDGKADLHAPKIAKFFMNAINVGSGGGATFDFDELRIGTTFKDVAPQK